MQKKTESKISKQKILQWDVSKKPLFVENILMMKVILLTFFEDSGEKSLSVDVDKLVEEFT